MHKFNLINISVKSPCLHSVFHPLTPLLVVSAKYGNLSMKPCNSVQNAETLHLILVAVQRGAVKMYVTAVEALRKKEI